MSGAGPWLSHSIGGSSSQALINVTFLRRYAIEVREQPIEV